MLRAIIISILLCAIAVAAGCCNHQPTGNMTFTENSQQHVVRGDAINWKPCPPGLPAGCELAVLEGSPKAPGIFTVRFRSAQLLYLRPHTHPKDERVTILKGKAAVAFGKKASRAQAKEFGPGDYYVNARGAIHQVWVEKDSILQITGIGPWQVNYVDEH